MHGFPYDIYAYKDVVEILKKHDLNYSSIFERFGHTRF